MLQSDLKLDGNALAGLLQELFGLEMTVADAHCRTCRQVNQMGRAEVYMNAPGVVARCPACGQVLMRVVRGGGRVWLDLSGIRCLELTDPGQATGGG
jgi:Zn finger protein HypA/HybF involved in hydrogenase expression